MKHVNVASCLTNQSFDMLPYIPKSPLLVSVYLDLKMPNKSLLRENTERSSNTSYLNKNDNERWINA